MPSAMSRFSLSRKLSVSGLPVAPLVNQLTRLAIGANCGPGGGHHGRTETEQAGGQSFGSGIGRPVCLRWESPWRHPPKNREGGREEEEGGIVHISRIGPRPAA